ncbi:MAG: hypothetical protein AAGD43_30760 [Pseudomonadota bacterium]
MRMTLTNTIIVLIMVLLVLALVPAVTGIWQDVANWALAKQRVLQNNMALAIQAVRDGAPVAWLALMAAAGTYGFVHAIGPGHGKFLIGGVGLGVQVSAIRLTSVAITSSIVQAIWAIILVYGGFMIFENVAASITGWSEAYLAPASHAAIAIVGFVIAWRGLRAFWALRSTAPDSATDHNQDHAPCGCGGHGPSPSDAARLSSLRDTVVLVLSIAVRPCTGALFLLVIAWQMDIAAAGTAAVIVMGLGTAAMTGLVAVSSVAARTATYTSSGRLGVMTLAVPSLQLISGLVVVWFATSLLWVTNL